MIDAVVLVLSSRSPVEGMPGGQARTSSGSSAFGRRCRPGPSEDRGSAVVWLLLILPVLMAFGGLVLDGGRVVTARQTAANLAEQAARQAVDRLDAAEFRTAGTVSAVQRSAAAAAASGYCATAAPAARCDTTVLDTGQVRVEATVTTRTALLAAVGVGHITVRGSGQARSAVGVTEEVQP